MKTIVLYKSETGFTKKYAQWIASDLNAYISSIDDFNMKLISDYDVVIFGGSLHAVGIKGFKKFNKYFDLVKNKKVIVFATGASPVKDEVTEEIIKANFTEEQKKLIKFFYFRGGFDYKALKWYNKVLMQLLKLSILRKKPEMRNSDETGMLAIYDKKTDYTKRENVKVITDIVNG